MVFILIPTVEIVSVRSPFQRAPPLLKPICPNRYNKFTIIVFAEVFDVWCVCVCAFFFYACFSSSVLILCGMCIKVISLDHSVGAFANSPIRLSAIANERAIERVKKKSNHSEKA